MTAGDAITVILLLWAVVIAVIDWRWRKVPNLLLLMVLLPSLLCVVWQGSEPQRAGLWMSLAGLATGLLLTLPGHVAKRLGAGDVKLAAVMGFVLGWPLVLSHLVASALLLGAMAFAAVSMLGFANARSLRLPAAVALAGGFAAVLLASREGLI